MRFSSSLIQPAGDVRGFVHKRIIGGVVGGFKGALRGGPAGIVGGAIGGFVGGGVPSVTACPPGFIPGPGGCVAAVGRVPGVRGFVQRVIPGGATGFEVTTPGIPQTPFQMRIARERAARVARGEPAIVSPGRQGIQAQGVDGTQVAAGLATLGRFGAAVEPTTRMQDIRECPRGMVLAVDSLCYSRRDVRNSERFWPRGRRPLLTGGEMRAISTAASAARKLQRKQKDLQALGLLPKATARRPRAAVAGHKATLVHG